MNTLNGSPSCPLDANETIKRYFMENRSRILDIAAFLERIRRSKGGERAVNDFRILSFRKAINELSSDRPGMVERIQMILSDLTLEPLETATKSEGTFGAPHGGCP